MRATKLPRERITIRLPVNMTTWLRRRASERHITITSVIEESVRKSMEREKTELLMYAALEGICRVLANIENNENVSTRDIKASLVSVAKGEIERAYANREN